MNTVTSLFLGIVIGFGLLLGLMWFASRHVKQQLRKQSEENAGGCASNVRTFPRDPADEDED